LNYWFAQLPLLLSLTETRQEVSAACVTNDFTNVIGSKDYEVENTIASVSSYKDIAMAGMVNSKVTTERSAFVYMIEAHATCQILWNYQFYSDQLLLTKETGGFRALEIRDEYSDQTPNVLAVAYKSETEEVIL